MEYELWADKEVSETTRRALICRLRSKLSNLDIRTNTVWAVSYNFNNLKRYWNIKVLYFP